MSTITTVVQPTRMYSWWWDSHISPKNSKWLTENLEDMDSRVRTMIKLIEEDADSFGRRAEMYYKKRPELMKLVEEFYREYRALAERYDHATGALYQAHRTITRVFPNTQVPDDDTATEPGPRTPDVQLDMRAFFTPDELMKDGDVDDVVPTPPATYQSSVRKGLKFDDERETATETEANAVSKMREERDSALSRVRDLELEVSAVRAEKERMFLRHERRVSVSDDDLVDLTVSAVQSEVLKDALERLKTESSLLRDLESEKLQTEKKEVGRLTRALMSAAEERDACGAERVLVLEKEVCFLQDEVNRLYMGAEEGAARLRETEERCGSLAGSNRSLRARLESLLLKLGTRCRELTEKQKELGELWACLQEERFRFNEVERAFGALQLVHFQHQEELNRLGSTTAIVEAAERVRAENVVLVNSVSDMSAELEATREKFSVLEESCLAGETAVESEKSALLVRLRSSSRAELDAAELSVGLEVQVVAMRESIRKLLESRRELESTIHELVIENDVLVAVLGDARGELGLALECEIERRRSEAVTWEREATALVAGLQASSVREAFFVKKTAELAGLCRDLCPTFEDCRVRAKDISLDRVAESSSETWRGRSGGDTIELRVVPVRDDVENGRSLVLRRLNSDEEKLGSLRGMLDDLRRKVGAARKQRRGKAARGEFDGVAEDLDGAEETAVKLLDVIGRLRAFQEKDGGGGSSVRKRFFEQARRVSERIGRLQVEVQKIQFVLVKMVNGSDGGGNGVGGAGKVKLYERRTRILLRDYLYGVARITSAGRRQSRFCACARPQTDP